MTGHIGCGAGVSFCYLKPRLGLTGATVRERRLSLALLPPHLNPTAGPSRHAPTRPGSLQVALQFLSHQCVRNEHTCPIMHVSYSAQYRPAMKCCASLCGPPAPQQSRQQKSVCSCVCKSVMASHPPSEYFVSNPWIPPPSLATARLSSLSGPGSGCHLPVGNEISCARQRGDGWSIRKILMRRDGGIEGLGE